MTRNIGDYDWDRLEMNRRTLLTLDNESIIDGIEDNWIENTEIFETMVSAFNSIFDGEGNSAKVSLGAAVICARRSCNYRTNSKELADELGCSSDSILNLVKKFPIPTEIPEGALKDLTAGIDEIDDSDYEQANTELELIPPEDRSGYQNNVLAAVAVYRAVNELGEKSAPQGRPERDEEKLSAKQVAEWFDVSRPAIHIAHEKLPRT